MNSNAVSIEDGRYTDTAEADRQYRLEIPAGYVDTSTLLCNSNDCRIYYMISLILSETKSYVLCLASSGIPHVRSLRPRTICRMKRDPIRPTIILSCGMVNQWIFRWTFTSPKGMIAACIFILI